MTAQATRRILQEVSRLGKKLRQAREAKGLGLKSAAPEIGVTYTYLSKIETGTVLPSDETLDKLAAYYDLDGDALGILAGRLPEDVMKHLQDDPERALAYLRKRFG